MYQDNLLDRSNRQSIFNLSIFINVLNLNKGDVVLAYIGIILINIYCN